MYYVNIEAIPENIETYGTNSDKLLHRLLYKDIHPVDLQFFLIIAYLMNQNIKKIYRYLGCMETFCDIVKTNG